MASKDATFGYLVEVVDSVLSSGHADQLRATTTMHDLIVAESPAQEPPFDVIAIRAPGSLYEPSAGNVIVEHLAVSGRNDRIERPAQDAVKLFWRFAAEKFGIVRDDAVGAEQLVSVSLTGGERFVLNRGLVEWGGPAHCTEAMALAMGFANVDALLDEGYRIADTIEAGEPLTRRDWTRALLATEISFASDVLGSGVAWPATTGLDDVDTLHTLRSAQRKLVAVVLRRGAWTPPRG